MTGTLVTARENGGEDREMQDVMFEPLSKVLYLDTAHCQMAELHGLSHRHHPETLGLVNKYL